MSNFAALSLKTTLAFGLLVSFLAQALVIPAFVAELANQLPELAPSVLLYTFIGILIAVCCQVVLIAIWALHTRVLLNRIFDRRATPWINSISIAIAVAAVLAIAGTAHLITIHGAGNPATIGILLVSGGVGLLLVLLISVLKSLLLQATEISDDLEVVI
jgi:hypothetical protein